MNNKTNKKTNSKTTIALVTVLLTLSIGIPGLTSDAYAACGTASKYVVSGAESATTDRGGEGKIKVKYVSICGTTNNQSYAHTVVSNWTNGDEDYVESGRDMDGEKYLVLIWLIIQLSNTPY